MLLRFSVKNYRSIADAQQLLFTASNLSGEDVDLIQTGRTPDLPLVPSVLIYGPNASGKSNILGALKFMAESVQHSHVGRNPSSSVPYRPFLLGGNWQKEPMEFELDFISDGILYNYGFHSTASAFEREWLYSYPKNSPRMLFKRTSPTEVVFGPTLKGRNAVIKDLMRVNSLFLSTAAQNNHDGLRPVSQYFSELDFEGARSSGRLSSKLHLMEDKEADIFDRVIDFLRLAETGVSERRFLKKEENEEILEKSKKLNQGFKAVLTDVLGKDVELPDIQSERKEIELGHQGEDGEVFYLPEGAESTGTIRLLNTLPGVFRALETGTFIAIDELEMGLHTKAAELVIGLFASRDTNPRGAQLLATTHDTNLLDSRALRRDQVWFTEKTRNGNTQIFPLSDFKVRKGDSMERGYLQGRFGAIPRGSISSLVRRQSAT